MECLPLLFAGMAMSTCDSGESVSQNAMVGKLTYADSEIGCVMRCGQYTATWRSAH